MRNTVILVDENDNEIGASDKLTAHEKGLLHRAFSIVIYNSKSEILLQKRAKHKYHSGGLWSNTCCSHPQPNEDLNKAIHQRLKEEMGFDCELVYTGNFIYQTEFDNGLIEHELDHVFIGKFDENPTINLSEAEDFRWILPTDLEQEIKIQPTKFTYWLPLVLNRTHIIHSQLKFSTPQKQTPRRLASLLIC